MTPSAKDKFVNNSTPAYAFPAARKNRLLESLPDHERSAVLARTARIHMPVNTVAFEQDGRVDAAYFPVSGMISMTTQLVNGPMVEIGIAGAEGFVGVPLVLGSRRSSHKVFVQVEADALRIAADDLLALTQEYPNFRDALLRYSYAVLSQAGQIAACNRLHEAEERLARWLLMVQDRLGSDELPLTHEFLSLMLGTRRATVTIAAGILQRAGVIRYTRGHIHVLDRSQLEDTACECYERTRMYVEDVFRPTKANGVKEAISGDGRRP